MTRQKLVQGEPGEGYTFTDSHGDPLLIPIGTAGQSLQKG
jgi:hypothetical protein